MTTQNWTPARGRGIVPLHPMTFGALLGKPFAALRHNPKVLFGFAMVLQVIVALIAALVMGGVLAYLFYRTETLSSLSSDEASAIMWGNIGMTLVATLLVGFISLLFTAILQGVVAANLAAAVLGEKATVKALWQRMRPALWRLIAWSAILSGAALIVALLIAGLIYTTVSLGLDGSGGAWGTGAAALIILLGCIPLYAWLGTKLLLVPSVLVLEHATVKEGIIRSWRLIRGRFWVALGIIVVVNVIMNAVAGVISVPLSLVSSLLTSIVAPTGDADVGAIIGYLLVAILPQLLLFAVQAVALVVQNTAATLIYIDSRMRYEGLDQDLIAHLERQSPSWAADETSDPFAVDPARAVTSAPPVDRHQPTPFVGYPQPGMYPQPGAYPQPGMQPQPGAYPQAPNPYGQTVAPPPPYTPATDPTPPPSETTWTAPGSQ